MSYKELIDETNKKLSDYSFNDEYYQGIYNKAIERLDSSYREGVRAINAEHNAARHKAVGENALATKSLQQELATRGLARSGESAMLSINQSLALRNTLAALARETLKAKSELTAGFNKDLSALEKEKADKILSAAEKDKQSLYDRLTHLESLDADRKEHLENLAANRTEHLESLAADRDKWLANYELELLKETNRAKEKDKELGLKESAAGNSKGEATEDNGDGTQLISPELSPERTANYIIQTCALEEDYIFGDFAQGRVRHNFAKLVCTMGLSEEYTKEVMHVLCSRGFNGQFDIEIATGKNFKLVYATYIQYYNDKYNDLVESGFDKIEARRMGEIVGRGNAEILMQKLGLSDHETKEIKKLLWD